MTKKRTGKKVFAGILCLLFLSILAMPSVTLGAQRRVFDKAGLFSSLELSSLEEKLEEFRKEQNLDLGVLTIADAEGKSTEGYADDFYDENGLGVGEKHSGALIVIDMDNRELSISTLGEMGNYLTDERIERILDDAAGFASDGNYAGCVMAAIESADRFVNAGIPADQHDYIRSRHRFSLEWYEILFAMLIAGVVAVMPCISTVNRYKMKKEKQQALNYRMAYRGSSTFLFDLTDDRFLNRMVSQRHIPRNTGGGSGGGSTSGRTTLHRSSSGRMHGGGGRKF